MKYIELSSFSRLGTPPRNLTKLAVRFEAYIHPYSLQVADHRRDGGARYMKARQHVVAETLGGLGCCGGDPLTMAMVRRGNLDQLNILSTSVPANV